MVGLLFELWCVSLRLVWFCMVLDIGITFVVLFAVCLMIWGVCYLFVVVFVCCWVWGLCWGGFGYCYWMSGLGLGWLNWWLMFILGGCCVLLLVVIEDLFVVVLLVVVCLGWDFGLFVLVGFAGWLVD